MKYSEPEQVKILDHGYVSLIESWGSDESIIEAARMSTNKGFLGWGDTEKPGDEKLLRFLYEMKHSTPFEMGGLIIEVQAPVFVFREWHRHRTQSFSELSARYTQMPNLHYIPSIERLMNGAQSTKNKQGSEAGISEEQAKQIQSDLFQEQENIYRNYEKLLNLGLAKELARLNTPVSRYSRMRAGASLRNWLAFLTLRSATAAQFEIRQYADAVGKFVEEVFPRTWRLFCEGKKNG